MTFYDCLMTCARSPDLVAQFNRLTGRHVGEKLIRSPLDLLVDQATGYDDMLKAQQDEDLSAFIEFCHTHVWLTLPRDSAAS
jgi:hypothetical protein